MGELDPFKNDETQTVFDVLTEGLSVNISYLKRSKNFVNRRALKHLFKAFYISQGYKLGIVSVEFTGVLGQKNLETVLNNHEAKDSSISGVSSETLRSANIFAENAWGEYRRIATSKGSYGTWVLPAFKSKMLIKAAASFYAVSSNSLDRFLERNSPHKVNDFYNFLVSDFLAKRVSKREVEVQIEDLKKQIKESENVKESNERSDFYKSRMFELRQELTRLNAPIGHEIMNFMHSLGVNYKN